MNVKEKLHQEQKELNDNWCEKRKIGRRKYILMGGIRCFLFIGAATLINTLITKDFTYDKIIVTLIASFFISSLSWCGNELRFRICKMG